MKTKIYNLIILDESGSMNCIWEQTVSGCNEMIDSVKVLQEKFGDKQEHFISIYSFQSGTEHSRYIIKDMPVEKAAHITIEDYIPNGLTPLYDAVGVTLSDLFVTMKGEDFAIASVTIITDGMENSSKEYSHEMVSEMIKKCKEKGWNFNFIGANIDEKKVSYSLNIDNSMSFVQNDEGVKSMFVKDRECRMRFFQKMNCKINSGMTVDEFHAKMTEVSKGYFDEDNS